MNILHDTLNNIRNLACAAFRVTNKGIKKTKCDVTIMTDSDVAKPGTKTQ